MACLIAVFLHISDPWLRKSAWPATQTARQDGSWHLSSSRASSGLPMGLPSRERSPCPTHRCPYVQWRVCLLGMDMPTGPFSLCYAFFFSLSTHWFIYPCFSCQGLSHELEVRSAPPAWMMTLICHLQLSLLAVWNTTYSWFYLGGIAWTPCLCCFWDEQAGWSLPLSLSCMYMCILSSPTPLAHTCSIWR